MAATPIDRYHVHKPTPTGAPRRLHPKQLPEIPTADALRPYAEHYIAPALDSIRRTLAADPHATSARHALPSLPAGSAEPARQLIAEVLHPLGAQVGPLKRSRGTRTPVCVIAWPAGWTPPEPETLAEQPAPGGNDADERSK